MKTNSLLLKLVSVILLFAIFTVDAYSQKPKTTTKSTTTKKKTTVKEEQKTGDAEYKKQAADLIEFLAGTLNAIGSEYTPVFEKQIMINESFSKIFVDENVQVEDDLDENRQIYSYKGVQAYLQDVDFFFKDVNFSFKIESVESFKNTNGETVFKFKTTRHLKGITITNDSVNSIIDRYIEINLNETDQSLKIVSLYTTKLNESAETLKWWEDLPADWKNVLKTKSTITDPIDYTKLKNVLKITDLDISNNAGITNLDPLIKLSGLKRLNCSNTKVSDLYPIRNLNKLEVLDISNTQVLSIEPLQYASELQDLIMDNTKVSDLTVVENFKNLKILSFANTPVSKIGSLIELDALEDLRLSGTKVDSLDALKELKNIKLLKANSIPIKSLSGIENLSGLEQISFSSTQVQDISVLSKFANLQVVYFDNTGIKSLAALTNNKKLEKIYCNNSGITGAIAGEFVKTHPKCLVIYNSDLLKKWWEAMTPDWKKIFDSKLKSENPTVEQMHELTLIQDLSVEGIASITSLEPASKLTSLRTLNISGTAISDLSPIQNLTDLQTFDCSKTKVIKLDDLKDLKRLGSINCSNTDITILKPLANCDNLETINAENTKISSLEGLEKLTRLKKILADNTGLTKESVSAFKKGNDACLVVYRTEELQKWWTQVDDNWKKVFNRYVPYSDKPTGEQLHQITVLKEIDVKEQTEINGLKPLEMLEDLEVLKFTDTRVNNLVSIRGLKNLKELVCPKNPISSLEAINGLKKIETLDCSSTQISDLSPLTGFSNLKVLKVSGTKIKKLKALSGLKTLVHLDISGTNVLFANPIVGLSNLKVLKCYNSRILKFTLKKFKTENPDCEVVE